VETREPTGRGQADGLARPAAGRARDRDPVLDAFSKLMDQLRQRGEHAAKRLTLPPSVLMALAQLTGPMPMKDLSQRLGCERSFVTAIADELEQRALVQREPDPRDRRVKNLVLTRKGAALRSRLDREFFAQLPWKHALDDTERATLLALLVKLLDAEAPAQPPGRRQPRGRSQPGNRLITHTRWPPLFSD
jgi:DNA-binding MarR family transcriptional regulator